MGNIFRKTEIENCKNEVEKIKKQIEDSTLEIQSIQEDIQNIKEDDGFRGGMSRELDRCIQHKNELKSILNKLELHLAELNSELKLEINTKLQVYELFGPNVTKTNKQYEVRCHGQTTKFTIDQYITLDELNGCDDMTGKDILNKIIVIADRLKKKIHLSDSSYKIFDSCRYSLSHFYILLHGESWYNTFGFKSKKHDENILHNETVRNLPLVEFIQRATDAYIKKELDDLDFDCDVMVKNHYVYKKELDPYGYVDSYESAKTSVDSYKRAKTQEISNTKLLDMKAFITTFDIDENTKVSTIISDIFKNYIETEKPTSCDHKIQLLKQFIDSSSYVLKYNTQLIREPRSSGGKTRKSKKLKKMSYKYKHTREPRTKSLF